MNGLGYGIAWAGFWLGWGLAFMGESHVTHVIKVESDQSCFTQEYQEQFYDLLGITNKE